MKIIVENGGSKLDWMVVERQEIYTVESLNLFDLEEVILFRIKTIFPSTFFIEKNLCMDFYTAGLNTFIKEKIERLFSQCFNNIQINFFSDMLAASRSLFKNKNGIACILGTGSNCAYFDGIDNHSITYSLGHLLGDEGSGYDLGKSFLISYFQDKIPINVKKELEEYIGMKKAELISSVYTSKNQKFYIASFARFLKKHDSNPVMRKIINKCFFNFLNNHPFKHPNFNQYKFGFVGGVAFHFRRHIDLIMKQNNLEYCIVKKPIKNLMNYYLN